MYNVGQEILEYRLEKSEGKISRKKINLFSTVVWKLKIFKLSESDSGIRTNKF